MGLETHLRLEPRGTKVGVGVVVVVVKAGVGVVVVVTVCGGRWWVVGHVVGYGCR